MIVTFFNIDKDGEFEVRTDGGSVTMTYEHLWDKTGDEPVLIGHFDTNVDRWIDAFHRNRWTDVLIWKE